LVKKTGLLFALTHNIQLSDGEAGRKMVQEGEFGVSVK
jgi:hypothetical protein